MESGELFRTPPQKRCVNAAGFTLQAVWVDRGREGLIIGNSWCLIELETSGAEEAAPSRAPRKELGLHGFVSRRLKLSVKDMSGEKQKVHSECATEMSSTPPTCIHVQCEGEVKQLMCY